MKNIVVLISGNGSNLQAVIDACENQSIDGKISAVFSNKADAYGLERATQSGIDAHSVNPKEFESRELFDLALMAEIDKYQPDLIILAGYMRILSEEFVRHYMGKMINIHPSLLPKYPGLHTHQRAIDAGDSEHGTSVHFVTEELDGGPVILQAKVPVFEQDDASELASRVQTQEHRIYPLVAQWFVSGRLKMESGKAVLDGNVLGEFGYAEE
ncbi:phosphoribosylglycinamide formyltransferase [Vibrio nigripulchritudo ATCC 27043]|uniref:Phosphoribosylglycinamide formyltransferase n=1 Tax=Vibrio nigripulchritudo TaxID=28173 RepID=U4KGA7_9VIBR|nr:MULTISPECIES: phosphoribosylglycinamide formyltransferase [Vibrio]EGU58160.1 phosphoribosylglycinamide formyltransferase [Vibrio nigripulchritudo ATCC 27043]UAB69436.1 phosphoribosylglycinamide formyltransferase [Vibrio sp. SCSIO 43132]CCN73861.1 phosphoribosylglycinamide formyltransferase [Vibrio nigripulchritudo SFn118]CCN84963.1 phosphoribosylglycinamide formyltransferase [Vibrio nigripulchritudo BLFn1]CCN90175.1 phosphoribosylglycinamide formyltransferase [Vibrio nigripulchritudo SFn27]